MDNAEKITTQLSTSPILDETAHETHSVFENIRRAAENAKPVNIPLEMLPSTDAQYEISNTKAHIQREYEGTKRVQVSAIEVVVESSGDRRDNSVPASEMEVLPVPLIGEARSEEPVDIGLLGSLAPVVDAIAKKTQAPFAIAMQSVLAAASVASQAFADVQTLHGSVPLSLFIITAANSGERKSSCDKIACGPIREIEEERRRRSRIRKNEFLTMDLMSLKMTMSIYLQMKNGLVNITLTFCLVMRPSKDWPVSLWKTSLQLDYFLMKGGSFSVGTR